MKKKLPSLKKSLKSFILEEDAKIIDKAVIKTSVVISFASLSSLVILSSDVEAFWKRHNNHLHTNNVIQGFVLDALNKRVVGSDVHLREDFLNLNSTENNPSLVASGQSINLDIPSKSVAAMHGNHFNHSHCKTFSSCAWGL